MNKPSFPQEKEEQKQSNKGDFKGKCSDILKQIKAIDEGKFHELNTIFHSRYFKDNIQKKVIIGFYGQLCNELKALKPGELTPTVQAPAKPKPAPKAKPAPKKKEEPAKKETKKVAKKTAKKETKKVAKKTAKKETKKVAKKTAKKETKKVAKKTAAKKATKKVAKKTTKKVAKKTTKKIAKKTTKKVTKKKR